MERPRQSTLVSWLLGGLLVAAVVFAYQPARNAGYIWDDDMYVTQNPLLTAANGFAPHLVFVRRTVAVFPAHLHHLSHRACDLIASF